MGKSPDLRKTTLCNNYIRHYAGKQAVQINGDLHQHRVLPGIHGDPRYHSIHPILVA